MDARFEQIVESILADGYGVLDNFLSPALVDILAQQLRQRRMQGQFRTAGIGNQQVVVETKIRGDEIMWLDEASVTTDEVSFLSAIDEFRQYVNQTCFLGLRESEFHYALYPPGTFYKRHLDQFRSGSRLGEGQRKLSVICYLNTDWHEADGGQLAIFLPDDQNKDSERTVTVTPVGGRLVCFESGRLEHEVRPATRERLSLTGWLKTGSF